MTGRNLWMVFSKRFRVWKKRKANKLQQRFVLCAQ